MVCYISSFIVYNVTEPEAEKDVFSDSSDGSDEIINLSSSSESEPEEETVQDKKENIDNAEPSQVPTSEDFKVTFFYSNSNPFTYTRSLKNFSSLLTLYNIYN